MKKTLTRFCFLILVCLSSLIFLLPYNNTYALAATLSDEVESRYLIAKTSEGSSIYLSNKSAGKTSGYGKFVLGANDVELTTTANHGFKLVGWQLTYAEQENKTEFIDCKNLEDNSKTLTLTTKDGTDVELQLTYLDENSDGYFEKGEFKIEKVFENLNVDPVFDFIHYNLDASQVEVLGALENHSKLVLNNEESLLFSDTIVNNGETLYKNAYIKTGEVVNYFGDLYSSEIDSETRYYTYHNMANESEAPEIVDYSLGAFRFGDSAEVELNVATNEDVYNSVNIDVVGVDIVGNQRINLNEGTNYTIVKDELLRTTQINVQFDIIDADNFINKLEINYHNLYVANIVTLIDKEVVLESARKNILDVMNVLNEFSKIDEGIYFVKSAENNSNNAFRVSTAPSIVKIIDGVSYVYYTFDNLDGQNEQQQNYYEINSNFNININFNSVLYTVDFRFVLLNDGALTVLDGYNVEKSLSLKRGESFTQNKTDFSNNLGFKFYGFALNREDITENTSIEVSIDETKPENKTVLMLFNFENYTIKFTNHDQINLSNGSNTINAISGVTLSRTRANNIASDVATSKNLRENAIINFELTFNVFDELELLLDINEGFDLIKVALAENGESLGINQVNLSITQAVINQYAQGNVLTFYVYEDFDRYTINYYIDPTQETNLKTDVIMAEIDVVLTDEIKKYALVERTGGDSENSRITITISNLKLYDKINLTSVGKTNELDGSTYSYIFIRFTENDKTSLTNYTKQDQTYIYTETVARNRNIKVVYSMPSSKLIVAINNQMDAAYDLANLGVFQNGVEITKNADDSYNVETGEIIIDLNRGGVSIQDLFAFGYDYVGYTYSVEGLPEVNGGANLTISIDVLGTSIQYLTLNFEYVEYRLKVEQINSSLDGQFVNFDGQDYMPFSLDNLDLIFTMPDGFYVSNAFFMKNGQNEYSALAQNNDYKLALFRHKFTELEFEEVASNYSEKVVSGETSYNQIVLRVVYQIHTYKVSVTFAISNAKNNVYDDYVNFPQLKLAYTYDGFETILNQELVEKNTVEFKPIPYGSNIILTLNNGLPSGFSATIGWADMFGNSLGNNSNALNIEHISYNLNYMFIMDYMSYSINLIYDSMQGNPQVYVNDVASNQITIFDRLTIYSNAVKTNGFKFVGLKYFATKYTAYIYSESSWNDIYQQLYILEGGEYTLNVSNEYDVEKTYFTMEREEQTYAESTIFNVENFNVNNFYVENNQITFTIEYDYIQIKISNTSAGYDTTEASLKNGDLNIAPEDYASFVVTKIDVNGNVAILTETDTVDFRDIVSVSISLNSVDLVEEAGVVNYSLSNGLYLHMVSLLGEQRVAVEEAKGKYLFNFNISDLIEKVPNDECINVVYYFNLLNKAVNLTTNVPNAEFYKSSTGRVNFDMTYDELSTKFGPQTGSSSGEAELSRSFQFLGKIRYTYSFASELNSYFVISQLKAYKSSGEEIDSSMFSRYGIFATYSNGEDSSIEFLTIRFVDNITVKLQITPIIKFNGALADGFGNYLFEKTFICRSDGSGAEQTITIGSTNNFEIQTSQFILNCLLNSDNVYDVYFKNSLGQRAIPINVGVYELIMNFSTSGEYAWMSNIQLDYKIYLVITPRNISLEYDINRTFEKTYDGKSQFNPDLVNKYLVLTDGSGLNIRYANQSNFVLQNYIVANITYTNRNEEVETSRANEDTFYNLYLTGFRLADTTFNNNYNLTTTNYVIRNVIKINRKAIDLTGIVVNDKVHDGTTDVTLGAGTDIKLTGILDGDDVRVITDNIKLQFENSQVGLNKTITVEAQDALMGDDASNYKLTTYSTKASIYPYSASVEVDGFGTIIVYNNKGLNDQSKVNLIPTTGKLNVEMIVEETPQYVSIYHLISGLLPRGRVYAYGFKIYFEENGVKSNLSKDLTLSLPNINKLTSVAYLTGEQVGELNYKVNENGDRILLDLNEFEADVNMIVLTKQRTLFKLWQIILIVISIILLIIIIIIIFLTIRKKKQVRYSINDRI